jgi:predicted DNA-binding protein YlxM (UPF0122 family)
LKRTVLSLENYETKLKLYEKYSEKKRLIEEYRKSNDSTILERLEDL